jgi:PadR family transcriptional regulator, regulatory protein PadR
MSLKTQIYKGVIEICILQLIHDGCDYGYDLVNRLNELGLEVTASTVYPILSRLHSDKFVEVDYLIQESRVPKKIYKVTELGQQNLKEMKNLWFENSKLINNILHK